jgi:hypothetical protein
MIQDTDISLISPEISREEDEAESDIDEETHGHHGAGLLEQDQSDSDSDIIIKSQRPANSRKNLDSEIMQGRTTGIRVHSPHRNRLDEHNNSPVYAGRHSSPIHASHNHGTTPNRLHKGVNNTPIKTPNTPVTTTAHASHTHTRLNSPILNPLRGANTTPKTHAIQPRYYGDSNPDSTHGSAAMRPGSAPLTRGATTPQQPATTPQPEAQRRHVGKRLQELRPESAPVSRAAIFVKNGQKLGQKSPPSASSRENRSPLLQGKGGFSGRKQSLTTHADGEVPAMTQTQAQAQAQAQALRVQVDGLSHLGDHEVQGTPNSEYTQSGVSSKSPLTKLPSFTMPRSPAHISFSPQPKGDYGMCVVYVLCVCVHTVSICRASRL